VTIVNRGLVVDLFAGGGGTSLGIEWAFGFSPDIAVNHDREAIAMHMANHPHTLHLHEDVRKVDIRQVVAGRPVDLLWLSPDCKHHSKAKGGKPVDRKIRGLAWEAIRWAVQARPRVICLENVQEFRDWGPLDKKTGRPIKSKKGWTYARFKSRLRALGYVVEDRLLLACDYGSPTKRERLFLVARCDGRPIVWPKPTHADKGAGGLLPWRPTWPCIDFSIPCPSIFLTREQAKEIGVKRPLAFKTERRVARGTWRFAIRNPKPFIVRYNGGAFRGQELDGPLTTLDTSNRFGLVAPSIIPVNHAGDVRVHSVEKPIPTITGAHRGEHALVTGFLVPRYGEREGQEPRCLSLEEPSPVVVPTQNGGSLVAAFLAKHNGGHEATGTLLTDPADTITSRDHHALVASSLVKLRGECNGADIEEPAPAITAQGNHLAEVRAFLIKYHDNGGQWGDLLNPAPTVVANDSIGLVMVEGEPHVIVDIGMRMLRARELFRCQGFPDSYQIAVVCDRIVRKKVVRMVLPAEAQVRMCGNSVPPHLSKALAAANLPELARAEEVA